jgi:hypothetical protein
MKFRFLICFSLAVAFLSVTSLAGNLSHPQSVSTLQPLEINHPLVFERNLGQYADAASFVARGAAYYLSLSPAELRITLQKPLAATQSPRTLAAAGLGQREPATSEFRALRIELLGANREARMAGADVVTACANYFLGNDPAQWRTGVPAYQRILVTDLYPGINLLHYGNQEVLEYDFEIAPGADPGLIAMRFHGADQLRIAADSGDLIVKLGDHELRQPKPTIYQHVRGQRKVIPGGYVLSDATTIKFELGAYDHSLPLVIDPVVSYVKFFGGPQDDIFWAIAVDDSGSLYLAGETLTPGLATRGAFQTNLVGILAGHGDVLIAKFNNQLTATNYITYLGGSAYEAALGLAVDGAGNAYVTGYTASTNFPTRFPMQTNIAGKVVPGFPAPPADVFITKLDASGSNLVFSTFYGGVSDDVGIGIALDVATNIYVAGVTYSTNFPTLNTAATNLSSTEDGFVLKLDASGSNAIYSMYLGGTGTDFARDVAVNAAGHPVVVGHTSSTNFPVTTNAFQRYLNQSTNVTYSDDAFFCELEAGVGSISYATYLGGTNLDQAYRVAVDNSGAAYVTGGTQSPDFPRTSTNFHSAVLTNTTYADAFVTKFNPGGTNLGYSVTFGGNGKDWGWDLAVDNAGRVSVVGETSSTDFQTNLLSGSVLRGTNAGGSDAFIAQLDAAGSAFRYSGYLGSPVEDAGYGVAVDADGNTYYIGITASEKFPTLPIANFAPFSDKAGFVVKIIPDELPSLALSVSGTNATLTWSALFPELSVQTSTNLAATNGWADVSATPVVTNAQTRVSLVATNPAQFFRLKK